jgi:lambda family phage portal protein
MGLLTKYKGWRAARLFVKVKALLNKYAKRFHAARPSRLDSPYSYSWRTDFNALIEQANPELRERIRSLVRNFPPFVRAINGHAAFVIGKGARFQSLVTDDDGQPDRKARQRIEDGFRRWMDRASVDGRQHFYDCQRTALRQRMETGEFFCCLRPPKDSGRHPLALQFIEPDRVEGGMEQKPKRTDSVVWQGIEFDAETGERYGYYIRRKDWPQKFEFTWDYIPADRIIHGFDPVRPDQLRGVSVFVPVIILADNMGEYIIAELDAAKMGSKWLGIVETPDPKEFQRLRKLGPKEKDEASYIESIENCILEYMRPGEKMNLSAAPDRVKDSFDRFIRFVLRMVGSVIGIPYEVLSGDYQGINYSTARMSRQDYNLILEPERFWIEQKFNRPVFREWLRLTALINPEMLPGYWKDPGRYEKALWVPAGMPSPDPLKEGKADIDNINAGLDSPQAVILSRGGDPEQVLEDLVSWQEFCKEKGIELHPEQVSTAEQTNPAALDEDLAGTE